MNPLTQFKKISIPPLLIAPAFVSRPRRRIVPASLGEGTQTSGSCASGCNGSRSFWSHVPLATVRAADKCRPRCAS